MAGNLYKNLKAEYPKMYAVVKDFPADLRSPAFIELVRAYEKSENGQTPHDLETTLQVTDGKLLAASADQKTAESSDKNLDWYAEKYNLTSINNMQFAAFVAYFYCEVAPDGVRVDAIDKSHLETASDIVGRDLPGASTLSDAKTKSGYRYLVSKGRGKYALSHAGKRYVKNDLLKENH